MTNTISVSSLLPAWPLSLSWAFALLFDATLSVQQLMTGTRDAYEIHHTCGQYDQHDVQPMEDRENIWESQWDPSSSQDAESEVGLKRPLSSDAPASSGRAKKVKGKGRISIGPDGSLSGF